MTGREDREFDVKRLPFTEHLRELRTRTIRAVVYIVLGFGTAWAFHEQLFTWLMEPYYAALPSVDSAFGQGIAYRSPIEPVIVYLKTSLVVGSIAVMPMVLLEAWLFVAPGLYREEKRLALPFLLFSVLCFLGGAFFCRYVVLSPAMLVLLGFGGEGTNAAIMMQENFTFTTRMLFVFGALFEMPVVISFLSMIGVVSHSGLIRNWKVAVVVAFVVGAMLTPPDPLTQIGLAVPLVVLYVVSIGLAYVLGKPREEPPEPDVES